jgi:alginate O-acetyltransferase complex protein AlgI
MNMSFTSFEFWVFFAAVFTAMHALMPWLSQKTSASVTRNLRQGALLLLSVAFYVMAAGHLVILILASIAANHAMAHVISRAHEFWRTVSTSVAVTMNVAMLAAFKYAYFVAELIPHGPWSSLRLEHWMLPLGISFYTFQSLSYILDIHRSHIPRPARWWTFATYITFFPQLVAGPIVRAREFLPQLNQPFQGVSRVEGRAHLALIVSGFLKKLMLGDLLGAWLVDPVFANPEGQAGWTVWLALYGYSLQVYADFSGYTDMAQGMAGLLGISLPVNFRSPYRASSPASFWRRWHISLSTWWKDYLYIPLGGNRHFTAASVSFIAFALGALGWGWNEPGGWLVLAGISLMAAAAVLMSNHWMTRIAAATHVLIVMLVGGLWHGAHVNFITWGAINGVALAGWVLVAPRNSTQPSSRIRTWLGWLVTFHIVVLSRIWFRAGSVVAWDESQTRPHPDDAWETAVALWNRLSHWNIPHGDQAPLNFHLLAGIALLLLGWALHARPDTTRDRHITWWSKRHEAYLVAAWIAGIVITTTWPIAVAKPFIYWQF